MKPAALIRAVKRALKEYATKVLILDDITRLKMHREADQDVLDFLRDLMSYTVVVLIGVGIPRSGLLREGRFDERTGEWLFPPVRDKGKSPNDEAATQTERRFRLVSLDPFSYDTPSDIGEIPGLPPRAGERKNASLILRQSGSCGRSGAARSGGTGCCRRTG